jgi:hypothetical protein
MHMTTNAVTAQRVDGNDRSKGAGFGEMDEAIDYDNPSPSGLGDSRVYFNYELFDLYKAPLVHFQRRVIEAIDDEESVGNLDEILVWLRTANVKLSQGSDITLEVEGESFIIQQASPEQRLHLLFMGTALPETIGAGVTCPLRIDASADPDRHFEITAIENLYLYGTPQFLARVFEQLALLPGYPELKRLLDTARQQYASVPDIVLMQRHAGPPQQGPGFDLQRVIPAKYSHLLPGSYTTVLYDPYDASGLDGLTTLARILQQAYDALAPDMLAPAPTSAD